MEFVRDRRGHELDSYRELWQWSVDDLDGFWESLACAI